GGSHTEGGTGESGPMSSRNGRGQNPIPIREPGDYVFPPEPNIQDEPARLPGRSTSRAALLPDGLSLPNARRGALPGLLSPHPAGTYRLQASLPPLRLSGKLLQSHLSRHAAFVRRLSRGRTCQRLPRCGSGATCRPKKAAAKTLKLVALFLFIWVYGKIPP